VCSSDLLDNVHKGSRVVTLREVPMSLEDAYMAISDLSDSEDDDDEPRGGQENSDALEAAE